MPRNKNKKKATPAGQRKQEEIQKRMQKAAENAEKKKSGGQDKAPQAQDAAAVPDLQQKKPGRPKSRHAPAPVVKTYKTLPVQADADGYADVPLPSRMSVQELFNAIRSDYPACSGHLYIRLDGADPEPGGHALSYAYQRGLFIRQEALGGRKAKESIPVLADLLDTRVIKLKAACTGDNIIDWNASALALQEGGCDA